MSWLIILILLLPWLIAIIFMEALNKQTIF